MQIINQEDIDDIYYRVVEVFSSQEYLPQEEMGKIAHAVEPVVLQYISEGCPGSVEHFSSRFSGPSAEQHVKIFIKAVIESAGRHVIVSRLRRKEVDVDAFCRDRISDQMMFSVQSAERIDRQDKRKSLRAGGDPNDTGWKKPAAPGSDGAVHRGDDDPADALHGLELYTREPGGRRRRR